MPKFILSPNAARSLADIDRYTEDQFGPQQADRYLEGLLSRINDLADHPLHGKSRMDLGPDLYCCFKGSHTIYYRFVDDTLQVIDILHQSMEPQRHLPKIPNQ